MKIEQIQIENLKSELRELAKKGCKNCTSQGCIWPDCCPPAKRIKETVEQLIKVTGDLS